MPDWDLIFRRYTDAEVNALIAIHAAVAAAHHVRYTDAEAVAAMGVLGDANPLNHNKYVLEEHGIAKHTNVTRTLSFPIGNYTTGTSTIYQKRDAHELATGVNSKSLTPIFCPSDLVTALSLKVIWVATGGTAGNDWVCDPILRFCTDNEAQNTHTSTPADATIDVTANDIQYFTDLSFVIAALAKGDFGTVEIQRKGTLGADNYEASIYILGMILTYTAEQ